MVRGHHRAHDSCSGCNHILVPPQQMAVRQKVALKVSLSSVTPGLFPVELRHGRAAGSRGDPVAYTGRRWGGFQGKLLLAVLGFSWCCIKSKFVSSSSACPQLCCSTTHHS